MFLNFVGQNNLGEEFDVFSFLSRFLFVRDLCLQQSFDFSDDQSDDGKTAMFYAEAEVETLFFAVIFVRCVCDLMTNIKQDREAQIASMKEGHANR